MLQKLISLFYIVIFSTSLQAGTVTIEKSDTLIRNDVFDQKRIRAEEYKQLENERNNDHQRWSTTIDPACGLLKHHYLIYRCANGDYYKAYDQRGGPQYRRLSSQELNELKHLQ